MPEIRIERHGAVGSIVFCNPAKFNAMSLDMFESLPAKIEELDQDPSIRVIVLRGDGDKAFVAGADISQFRQERQAPDAQQRYDRIARRAYEAPVRAGKPTIAQVRGICMGAGLGLAAACDLRVCSQDVRFRMPAARLGLGYNPEGVARFVSLIGVQNTLDVFFTARIFGAEDARQMGFVSRVAENDQLEAVVMALANSIAGNAPLSLRAAKLAVTAATVAQPTEDQRAALAAAILACGASADNREGALAFMEKRSPVFRGE